MREVTSFIVSFPTRLMSASYDEKKSIMQRLGAHYPHFEFEALEAFDQGVADDDYFGVFPVMGKAGLAASVGAKEIILCKPLDPRVIPAILETLHSLSQPPQALAG